MALRDPSYYGMDAPPEEPQGQGGLEAAVQNVGAYTGEKQKQAKQQQALENINITSSTKDGKVRIDTDIETANVLGGLIKAQQHTQQLYDQMVQRNLMQQARLQQHPWANTLATIAGSLASNDPNPITRGLGQAAQKLNPTLPELQAQQMQLLQGQGQAISRTATTIGQAQTQTRLAEQMGLERERLGLEKEREGRLASSGEIAKLATLDSKWDDRAAKGLFSPEAYKAEYKRLNPKATDEEVKAAVTSKQELQQDAARVRKELGDEKFAQEQRKAELAYEQAKKTAAIDWAYKKKEIDLRSEDRIKEQMSKGGTGKKPSASEIKDIQETEQAAYLLKNLEDQIQKNPDLIGPAVLSPTNATRRFFMTRLTERGGEFKATFDHNLPFMVSLLKEGTRGYAPYQSKFVMERVPDPSDTPERMRGKIAFLYKYLEARRAGTEAGRQFVDQQMRGGSAPAPMAPSHGTANKPIKVSLDEIKKYAE